MAWSLDALRQSKVKKKVLVLLTDGDNEPAVPHPLDPRESARLAASLGVTLHTIAIGRSGGIVHRPEPITGLGEPMEVDGPNLPLLREMAELGGGRPFVATDADALDAVFRAIDALEKSPFVGQIRTRYHEWYAAGIAVALAALMIDRLLCATWLRRLP